MNYRSVTQSIARVLSTAEGVGRVHPLRVFAHTPEALEANYTSDGVLNGWTISRESAPETHIGLDNTHARENVFVIRGFFALDAETDSELRFNEILENICNAFAPSSDLGEEIESHDPLDIRSIDYVSFGNTTAHYCELVLTVYELLDR